MYEGLKALEGQNNLTNLRRVFLAAGYIPQRGVVCKERSISNTLLKFFRRALGYPATVSGLVFS